MVWRDVAAHEPRIRVELLGSAMRARRDQVRTRLTDACREAVLRPAVPARIVVPVRTETAGARW